MPNSNFKKTLSGVKLGYVPTYCTGYPEQKFVDAYIKRYSPHLMKNQKFILNQKNYSFIKALGFDAVSLWDYRRGKGGYKIGDNQKVDGWGRIYRDNWYDWKGVFIDEYTVDHWEYLNLPSCKKFQELKSFLKHMEGYLDIVISLPGLFEKTWQSMGMISFAKSLREEPELIRKIVNFFTNYLKSLILKLKSIGAEIFLIADDCGYNKRLFIPPDIWREYFFSSYKKIADLIHQDQNYVILHSDGYITDLINIFIEIGFDGLQSLEPNAGVDIFSLFQLYSGKICLIGNLDINYLVYQNPTQIKNYTEKLITFSKKCNAPLIISPTQQINSIVKPANIKAMLDAAKVFSKQI